MQPTEPTPSTDVQQPESVQDAEPSEQSEENSSQPSWWRRFISPIFHGGTEEGEDPDSTDAQASQNQPPVRTMTEEEFHRSVQSEVDRREAKRAEAARAAEKRRLRDEDPWAYAEQDRTAEQIAEQDGKLTELLQGIGAAHDAVTLMPLMQTLPDEEQKRLMALPNAGVGTDGRKMLTTEALKSLEKHWRSEGAKDAEAKLRKNGSFRKQVFSEFQGRSPEPELLPSGSARSNGRSSEQVNDLLRRQLGIHKQA
jgi:hypothetical protein